MEEDPQSLRMWFDSVDTDQSNSINVEELQVSNFLASQFLAKLMLESTLVLCCSCGGSNCLPSCTQLWYPKQDKFLC